MDKILAAEAPPPTPPCLLGSLMLRASSGKRRVALYGGSFDPITNAHLNVAAEIIHSKKADEVWVIPCGPRPDKPSLQTSALNRFLMCHLAVNGTFGPRFPIKVCDVEVMLPVALATMPLITILEKKHPDTDFCFVLGEDLLDSLKSWTGPNDPRMGERLFVEKKFLVINRPGYSMSDKDLPKNFERVVPKIKGATLVETRLSSSEVRKRLHGGRALVLKRTSSLHTPLGTPDNIVAASPIQRKAALTPTQPTLSPEDTIHKRITLNRALDWYDEIEGLVPLAVLSFIKRYRLYCRGY